MDWDAADAVTIPDAKSGDAHTAAELITDSNPNRDTVRNADAAVRNPYTDTERHSDTYADADAHSDAFADANADPVVCVQRETARQSGVMRLPGSDVSR